jgi:hypothetical protein
VSLNLYILSVRFHYIYIMGGLVNGLIAVVLWIILFTIHNGLIRFIDSVTALIGLVYLNSVEINLICLIKFT